MSAFKIIVHPKLMQLFISARHSKLYFATTLTNDHAKSNCVPLKKIIKTDTLCITFNFFSWNRNVSVCLLSGTEFTTDDQCVVSLLKGLCLKHLGFKEEAEHYFTLVLCKSVLLFCCKTNHTNIKRCVCGFSCENLSRHSLFSFTDSTEEERVSLIKWRVLWFHCIE